METGQHSAGLRRLKERQGLSSAPVGNDGAAGARGHVSQRQSAGEGKGTGLGVRKRRATSAQWPQVSPLTCGLILHG